MFSKVCTFLKSRCDSVRETASDTLIRMMTTLGPVHLSAMLSATEPILQRGFQVHVYIYTVHAVLVKMVELGQIQHGSLDAVVHPLVKICKKELLGTATRMWRRPLREKLFSECCPQTCPSTTLTLKRCITCSR